jgi:hypothetical protein
MDKKNLLTKSSIFDLVVIVTLGLTSVWNKISPTEPGEVKCWMTASTESCPLSMEIKLPLCHA